MKYGRIVGVDKPVARVVQGTAMLIPGERDSSFALLDDVFSQGGTTFDTAESYQDGECEDTLGQWLHERELQDQVVIIGKGAHPRDGRSRVTPQDIRADVEASLKRLRIDRIDLYLLHRDDPTVPVGPVVETLDALRATGKIGAYGGSNWSAARIDQANRYADTHGLRPFVASSPNYSLAVPIELPWEGCISINGPQAAAERLWYAEHDIAVLAWSSLAGGFFSGRISRTNLNPRNHQEQLCIETYGIQENFERLDRARTLSREKGATLPQIALAFVLAGPLDTFAITGASSGARFGENVGALAVQLSERELAWLDLKVDDR